MAGTCPGGRPNRAGHSVADTGREAHPPQLSARQGLAGGYPLHCGGRCVVTAVESRQRKIPIWTAALELVFVWLAIYAIFKLGSSSIHRIASPYLPVFTILAGAGAIFSVVLWIRVLTRSASDRRAGQKRTVHPLLPVFLGCLTAGFCAAAIGYAGQRYTSVEALVNIGPKFSVIGGVFMLAALLASLLAPLLVLARKRQGPPAKSEPQ